MKLVGYDILMQARGSAMWGAHSHVEHGLIIQVMFNTSDLVTSMMLRIITQEVEKIVSS